MLSVLPSVRVGVREQVSAKWKKRPADCCERKTGCVCFNAAVTCIAAGIRVELSPLLNKTCPIMYIVMYLHLVSTNCDGVGDSICAVEREEVCWWNEERRKVSLYTVLVLVQSHMLAGLGSIFCSSASQYLHVSLLLPQQSHLPVQTFISSTLNVLSWSSVQFVSLVPRITASAIIRIPAETYSATSPNSSLHHITLCQLHHWPHLPRLCPHLYCYPL